RLSAPALEIRCSDQFFRCSTAAAMFRQPLELTIISAAEAAAAPARLAESAVFAPVTSGSGRLDQRIGAPTRAASHSQAVGPDRLDSPLRRLRRGRRLLLADDVA